MFSEGSSPRKRGCFPEEAEDEDEEEVFPAQAGVFPGFAPEVPLSESLPRASGGVSEPILTPTIFWRSSPRKRGCFCERHCFEHAGEVFPAQAGVFPKPLFAALGA